MRAWLLNYLKCVACPSGTLEIGRKDEVRTLSSRGGEEVLVDGVLECKTCEARYPVLAEAPRMLRPDLLCREERGILNSPRGSCRTGGEASHLGAEDRESILRRNILRDYGNPVGGASLRRALAEVAYQRSYAGRRRYQMALVKGRLGARHEVVADIGGGSGGNIRAADGILEFRYAIVADINTDWPPCYQTGDRDVAYVRADATELPLRSHSLDLVISSFLIEHVKRWTNVISEIGRIGKSAFIGFGPNRLFPYEIGHLDAPLAHCLPPGLGALAAYAWGHITGNRRSLGQVKQILDGMNYISSHEYYRFCREAGFGCENIFSELLVAKAKAVETGPLRMCGKWPRALGSVAKLLAVAGMEPNVYSILNAHETRDRSAGRGGAEVVCGDQ